jgi:hypothetical protein
MIYTYPSYDDYYNDDDVNPDVVVGVVASDNNASPAVDACC